MNEAAVREILNEKKWKYRRGSEKNGYNCDTIDRYIEGVDRSHVDDIYVYARAYTSAKNEAESSTVEDPMAGTIWFRDGTWYGGRLWYEIIEEGPYKDKLRFWQRLYKGDKTNSDYYTERGSRFKVETTWYYGQQSIPACPANSNGIKYRMGPVLINEDHGTYTTFIDKISRLYQTEAEHVSTRSPALETKTTKHYGVKTGDKNDAGVSIGLPDVSAATKGKIIQIDREKNDDDTDDINLRQNTPKDQTADSQEESLSRSVVEHTHTENPATPAAPVAEKGKIKRVDAAPTEAGNLRTAETTTTPKDQESVSTENSLSRARTATLHTENPDTPTPATEVKGQINRVEVAPTEAGNLRTVEETITPKDQVADSQEESLSRSVVEHTHTENPATPAAPVAEKG
ncbi:MAG: hypothetical protein WC551_12500, partial [Patescibacteria group bacterium]